MATEKQRSKKQAWFCSSSLISDIEIEVDDMTFHLHKFPLVSKSRKLEELIREHEQSDKKKETPHIRLENFPGGWEIFELVVKIWYGEKVDFCASTAVSLRCAAEELEMKEEYSPDNLISKMDKFLSQCVFNSLRESIKALKACESVSPLAESLGITKQCIESIVSRASSAANQSLFGWPVSNGNAKKQSKESKTESWIENLTELSFPIFIRLIQAMKSANLSPDIVERCLVHYAKKHIPGSSSSSSTLASEKQQRELLEIMISDLPTTTSSIRSLFGLLRSSIILKSSEKCRTVLERKIGSQLEKATLDDLLIPSYSYLNETLYDVDLVERLLRHFLDNASAVSLTVVGKLIDGVLGEIASDANLKPEKFYNLAVLLPGQARLYDDGIYRAIDIYLKSHSWISIAEKEKICSVMDCRKLTLEGCTHAARNERLPLRAIVNVLFLEQIQLRETVSGTEQEGDETTGEEEVDFERWEKTVKENQVLRLDIETMMTRVHQLERERFYLEEVIVQLEKENSLLVPNDTPRRWSISKRFGCKFKTQICDSHEVTMVHRRSSRHS